MHGLRRKTAAMTAAALLLVGTSMLAFPGSARAETKTAECGGEVTAKPGDRVVATDPLLGAVPLDLGVVTESTNVLTGTINALLGQVCKVTVTVIDTVVKPVPGVGDPAAEALKRGAKDATGAARGTVDGLGSAVAPSEPQPREPEQPDDAPAQQQDSGSGGSDNQNQEGSDKSTPGISEPNSVAIGNGVPLRSTFLPFEFSTGFAPMRDYSGIPTALPGLYAPSPGVRYGSQIPGYTPEFDILGSDGPHSTDAPAAPEERVSKAGGATALPGSPDGGTNPASLPVLLAVIALAASTAALVRTWVLRRA